MPRRKPNRIGCYKHYRKDPVTRIDEIRAWFDEGWASKGEWASLLQEGHTSQGEEDRPDRSLLAFILHLAQTLSIPSLPQPHMRNNLIHRQAAQ